MPFSYSLAFLLAIAVRCLAEASESRPPSAVDLPAFFMEDPTREGPRFLAQTAGVHAQFTRQSVTWVLAGEPVEVRFSGANSSAAIEGQGLLAARANFLIGRDPENWRLARKTFECIIYRGLYPQIDLTYRQSKTRLKSEFIVRPGGDPQDIRLEYTGTPSLDGSGRLIVRAQNTQLTEEAPVIYQDTPQGRIQIAGRFEIHADGSVGFDIGEYDRSLTLVIDPVISYSTYLGGTGQGAITGLAVDSGGNLYAAGWTEAIDFPITGAYQASNQGGVDAFVVKLNPAGSAVLYATYIGGRGDDRAAGIAVDLAGQAYVVGSTASANFPLFTPARANFSGQKAAFALKLNAIGNALVYSTYLSGSVYELGTAIAADAAGNAYVAGDTQSTNFPVLGGVQTTNAGLMDAFVTKLTPTGAIAFSTYLGGSGNEHAGGIAVDLFGNVYVTGGTYSANFPRVNALQSTNGGNQDVFVTKIAASGTSILYSTYLGGSGAFTVEQGTGIAVTATGNAYVTGVSNSSNFPVTTAAVQKLYAGSQDAFVAELSPTGTSLVYCTYLGGTQFDWASGIRVDSAGTAYIAGYTASLDFPTAGRLQTFGGLYDAFAATISPAGDSLTFSTFYGGSGAESANAIAVDAAGNIFIGGQSSSLNLPLAGAIQSSNNGGSIGWAARLGVTAPPAQTPSALTVTPSSGTGSTAIFTATYSDTAGAAALQTASILINATASTGFGCYVTYNVASNTFQLANNDPSTGSQNVTPGGGSQVNDQCQLNGVGSSATTSASGLSVTVSITFQPNFAGAKAIYLSATDVGASTGFVSRGSWTVTIPPPQPSADSVSPNSGMGSSGTFTFVFSDTQSPNNLTTMAMLVSGSLAFQNACYVVLDRNAGTLQLLWDSAAGSDSRPVGGSAVLQNSQCQLGAATVQAAGLSQIVTLNLTFKGAFSGLKNIYLFGAEGSLNTGWVQRGTFTVAAGGVPMVGAAVPASGFGPGQRFSFTFADQGGSSYINGMAVLIASSLSTQNACSIVIDRTSNKISLGYDNPSNGATSLAIGSNTIVSNNQCTLKAANSTVIAGTTSIVVTLDLAFNAAWFGAKNIYAYAGEVGVNTGFVQVGSWTVTGGAPTADSVSPSSGSGTLTNFTFTVSDSAVQTNITGISMLFTAGSPANLANACYMFYNRTNSTIGLYDNAGTTLNTKPIGASTSLQNSQCAVGYTVMNTSGNSVIFTIQVYMQPAFSGPKSIYMQAHEPAASSGWVARGTWTAP